MEFLRIKIFNLKKLNLPSTNRDYVTMLYGQNKNYKISENRDNSLIIIIYCTRNVNHYYLLGLS